MPRIICVGTAVFDQVFAVPAIPAKPVKVLATAHATSGGGMAVTAAIAIAALGAQAEFWGRLGDDMAGVTLRGWISELGVDVRSLRTVPGGLTATSAILTDPAGERLLAAFPGDRLGDDATWLPLAEIAECAALLCDVRWLEGARTALEAARAAGVPTVLDADVAPHESLRVLIRLAGHVLFSERGLTAYTDTADPEAGLRQVAAETAAEIGVTLGADGVGLLIDGRYERVPAPAVVVRDTNGAGDTFHGAYALAIAEGRSTRDAALFANAAAAVKCALGNGWNGMPKRDAVENLIKRKSDAIVSG